MTGSEAAEGDGREETSKERLDRNFEELTGELRVFDTGFEHIGTYERIVYFVTLLLASMSALCMIAPSAQHRFLFRHDDKRHIVFTSNRIVIAGLVFLALAMCGCLLLVATKLFGELAGLITLLLGALPFATLWFAVPLSRRRKLDSRKPDRAGP
jgi:hypothetical protein